ncbi:MAG: ATP-dependent zinc metalloprotease FtsH [Oscillospiraceae bacterium]|nr:ATP-dependent zinc metalloprotease FtsH [Oscillospiraceae bacterium]
MLKNKFLKSSLIYIAILLVLVVLAAFLLGSEPKETIKYYELMQYFNKGEVEGYTLNLGNGDIEVSLKDEDKTVAYRVPNVNLFLNDIMEFVREYNQENPENPIKNDYIRPTEYPAWLSMLPSLLLIVIFVGFWFYMMNNGAGGAGKAMSFGKVKLKNQDGKKKTTFEDVAGADEEKEELVEIVDFLKNPVKFNELGARIPKGVLLMGPPGTGKTLLARAVAGEAGVPFFSISGSDFVEMFVGVGASRVRDLFEQAKKESPSIIFIDEIDAVGRHRGAGLGGGHDEREQTLNQLLVEMDGFDANSGIIVIAATNRNDILDPALLRPGRFDRQIVVNYPDAKGREEILKVHSKNKPIGPDVNLETIAKTTAGFTGADLENLLNEAALLAARKDKKAITQPEIEEATIKVVAGPEKKSKTVIEKERKITAIHEAGHAITTYFCKTQDPVHQVSIIPRGMAGGYTMHLPTEDRSYRLKKQMFEEIVVLLGGRVAEKIMLDDISTGASNDIERATKLAHSMITRYGFSEKLGPIVYGSEHNEVFLGRDINQNKNFSENVASEIDQELRAMVDKAYNMATNIIEEHKDKLIELSDYLLHNEKITGEDFAKLMDGTLVKEEKPQEENAKPQDVDTSAEKVEEKTEDNSENN